MTRMSIRLLAPVAAVAVLLLAPASAGACASDDTAYLDSFPDMSCLLTAGSSNMEIDADGGLRLATGGTATPTSWDTPAQFDNAPTGVLGSLRVVGSGPGATLELLSSGLALTPTAPALSPTGAELTAGPTQVRDSEGVEDPSVIRVGSKHVMYYTGYAEDGSPPAIYRVESDDGRTWTRPPVAGTDPNPAPVLTAGAPGSWDAAGVFGADVLYDPADAGAPYRMYYSGVGAGARAIGYATSSDGITWSKSPDPVLRPGLPGSRDGFAVAHPSVLKDGGLFKMWYEGDDSTVKAIGYATSADGVAWKRAGLPATLQQDPLGGGDPKIRFGIFAPTVWKTASGFRMLLGARNATDPTSTRIVNASSADGVDWTLGSPEENPHSARFYATNFFSPDVLADPGDNAAPFKLYFAGDRAQADPADDRSRIGLAEAASADGNFGVYTGPGADSLAAVYVPGADSTRFDARNIRGLSVADPGGSNDWVGAYAGTSSTRTGGTADSAPRLGIATRDAGTSTWTKRDGAQADTSLLPLADGDGDAKGQRDPSLIFKHVDGSTDDWWLYYTALPSAGSPAIRVASSDEDTAPNELRPTAWTKGGLVLAGASHPSALRQGAATPVRIYHTAAGGTSIAMIASTANDDLDGPFGAPVGVSFTGPASCDPDGARDPAVILIGTTLHMLYTGLDGTARNTCYATASIVSGYTSFTRGGRVMPPSGVPHAYDERQLVPSSMFLDTEDPGALNVFLTGTDRGERRFVDALGNTAVLDQHTRVGGATSPLPISTGLLPSGTATGQLGTVDGTPLDFRRITRIKTGAKVEMAMSVLQPYSSTTDPAKQFWSDWFAVIAGDADTASEDLTFRFGVRAVRWRARLSEPAGTPKLDTVTVESGPLQFESSGTMTTTEIRPPDGFTLASWTNLILRAEKFTFPNATATDVAAKVTVLGADDAVVVPQTDLALTAGADQAISLASVSAAAHPRLKVRFDMTASGSPPRSTPLVKQLRVTYTAAQPGSDQDGDGIADAGDQCPAAAGPTSTGGCPDGDADGIADAKDACPSVAGAGAAAGCPDADGDGVADARDACPAVASAGSPNGCPIALTLTASATKVVYGRSAVLRGALLWGPLSSPGRAVTVLAKPVGATASQALGTAVTDLTGKWTLTVRPTRHTTYSATLAGVASPPPVAVRVAHKLTLRISGTGARRTFSGALSPRHARRTITIQRRSGSRWLRFATVRTTRGSTFKVTKGLRKGRHEFRAITARDTQHLAGRSAARRVTVR